MAMQKFIKVGILIVVAATLIVGYYFYLSHGRKTKEAAPKEQSELEKVLTVDFEAKYPQTPREVMKWYNRIVMLYYSNEPSENQIDLLCDQAMMLFDADLIQVNPREAYIASVHNDINDFHTRGKKMIKADVCDTNDVAYKRLNGNEMAYVLVNYMISEGNEYQDTYQKFALRKNPQGRWKIIAFELSTEDGI